MLKNTLAALLLGSPLFFLGPLGGCTQHTCTAMGVSDGASLAFRPALSEPGLWTFELEGGGLDCVARARLGAEAPSTSGGSTGAAGATAGGGSAGAAGGGALVPVAGAAGAAEEPDLGLPECPFDYDGTRVDVYPGGDSIETVTIVGRPETLPSTLPTVRYTVRRDGEIRFQGEAEFDYSSSEPNGEGCGEVYASTHVIDTDGN